MTITGASALLMASAQTVKTCYVPKAGTLHELIAASETDKITHLVLQGTVNATDFCYLREHFTNLRVLDISHISINMYAGKRGTYPKGFYVYPGNCIPAYAFCTSVGDTAFVGKTSLRQVILSDKTKRIEESAFRGCNNLKIVQVRKKEAPKLLSQALADSVTAVFVPLGCSDAYRNEEQWEDFAIIEGDPVCTTVQIDKSSSLARELQRQGLQPKDVNFLTIEGEMTEDDFTLLRNYMPALVSVNLSKCHATTIPDYTFSQKRYLLSIKLPNQLVRIGQRAFSGCVRLCGTLELPPTVTSIEFGAFIGCENLHKVVATGNRITALGDKLFGEEQSKLVYKEE